jgi:hypothetical protein
VSISIWIFLTFWAAIKAWLVALGGTESAKVNSARAPTIDAPLTGKTQTVTKTRQPPQFPPDWRDDLVRVAIQSTVGAVKFSNYWKAGGANASHNQDNRNTENPRCWAVWRTSRTGTMTPFPPPEFLVTLVLNDIVRHSSLGKPLVALTIS